MPYEPGKDGALRRNRGPKYDLFISYASVDRPLVEPFVRQLERDEFAIYFDQNDVVEFRPLPMQLADAMDASSHILLCLTPAYMEGPWATFEAQNSLSADPSGAAKRIVPVWLERSNAQLPPYLRHLPYFDLSEHDPFGVRYRKLANALNRAIEEPPALPDRAENARRWREAFAHPDDQDLTLYLVRRAAQGLTTLIHQDTFGERDAAQDTLDALCDQLFRSGRLRPEMSGPLGTLRALFSPEALRDEAQRTTEATREAAGTALAALQQLGEQVFPEHAELRQAEQLWDLLPTDGAERSLPGTPYRLWGPMLWRSSAGPLYAGRNSLSGAAVTVVLASGTPPPVAARTERAPSPATSALLIPTATGVITIDGVDRGSCLVLPDLDGESVEQLVRRSGPLPPRAAYEVGAALAVALIGLHEGHPPQAHGPMTPGDVMVEPGGAVRLLALGAEPTAGALDDLAGLRSTLARLMTGSDTAPPAQRDMLDRLAGARHARDALRVLRDAVDRTPKADGLASVVRRSSRATGGGLPHDIALVDVLPIAARLAWPRGAGEVVVWTGRTGRLRSMLGDEVLWEDAEPIDIRRVEVAKDGRLAVGGWEGAVRYFTAGAAPVAAFRIDGTVGDLRCVVDALIVGSWQRALWRVPDAGGPQELLPVRGGVHRIAVSPRGDRFAIAELSGRIDLHLASGDRQGAARFAPGPLADLAYAGTRIVLVSGNDVAGLRVDGSFSEPVPLPGAFELRPQGDPGHCLLLARSGGDGGPPVIRLFQVDEQDRHIPYLTLPPGDRLLSADALGRRLITAREGGCAYWRDRNEVMFWPEAGGATVSADGRLVAVCGPDQVHLYEDRS